MSRYSPAPRALNRRTIEEIVATAPTGSRIARQSDSASPLSVWNRQTLRDAGAKVNALGKLNRANVGVIDSFTALDLLSRFSFAHADNLWFALGVANLLDQHPPRVNIGGNYDPRSADPRGQRVYLSIGVSM